MSLSLRRVVRSSFLIALLVASPPALAGTLPFTGTLGFHVATLPPIAVGGTGVATVNGSGGGGHLGALALPASVFATTHVVPITDPAVFPIVGVAATMSNDAGSFAESGGTLGGVMPLRGIVRICIQYDCAAPALNLSVPLSVVGAGGSKSVAFLVNLTIQGEPWTTGEISVGTFLTAGFAHGPASGTSSTAAASGVASLVTPIHISTNIAASATIPTFVRLTLHFVPEPATALLLGGGCAWLAWAGRRRAARRSLL